MAYFLTYSSLDCPCYKSRSDVILCRLWEFQGARANDRVQKISEKSAKLEALMKKKIEKERQGQ